MYVPDSDEEMQGFSTHGDLNVESPSPPPNFFDAFDGKVFSKRRRKVASTQTLNHIGQSSLIDRGESPPTSSSITPGGVDIVDFARDELKLKAQARLVYKEVQAEFHQWYSASVQRDLEELKPAARQTSSDTLQPFDQLDIDEPVQVDTIKPDIIIQIPDDPTWAENPLHYNSCTPSSRNIIEPLYPDFIPNADDPEFDKVNFIQLDTNTRPLAWQDPDNKSREWR